MWWNGAKFEELIIRLALVLNMWGGKYKFVMQMVVEFKHKLFFGNKFSKLNICTIRVSLLWKRSLGIQPSVNDS
jgi:hypothetical protein